MGPSVARDDLAIELARLKVEAHILPPVSQGSVLTLLTDPPGAIVIIDGYFWQEPSVLHKEILLALERGVRVLGAASMGALRAVELDHFGMEGIGQIYSMYRRGVIDGDDEVAVLHASQEEGFRPTTVALVNLRHNLHRGRRKGIVSAATSRAILGHAKSLSFDDRVYGTIFASDAYPAPLRADVVSARQFVESQSVDLKRQDAFAVLHALTLPNGQPPERRASAVSLETKYLYNHRRQYQGQFVGCTHVPDTMALGVAKLLCPWFVPFYRRIVRRCLAAEAARRLELRSENDVLGEFRHREGLHDAETYAGWLRERSLSEDDLCAELHDGELEVQCLAFFASPTDELTVRGRTEARIRCFLSNEMGVPVGALKHPLRIEPGLPWETPFIRALKRVGRFGPLVQAAGKILAHHTLFASRHPWFAHSLIPAQTVQQWLVSLWAVKPDAFDVACLKRGFLHERDAVGVGRYAYMFTGSSRWSELEEIGVPKQPGPHHPDR